MALDLSAIYGRRRPTPGVGYFFSRPSSGGACKRLNLFLRWVARQTRRPRRVNVVAGQLVVPLDTHVVRVGPPRRDPPGSPGWKMAMDVTPALRDFNPDDPVRYDFSMCHLGMGGWCGFGTTRPNASAR